MTNPLTGLAAAVNATRAYQSALTSPAGPGPSPAARRDAPAATAPPDAADIETLGRLAAPVVSRLLARDIRERGRLP